MLICRKLGFFPALKVKRHISKEQTLDLENLLELKILEHAVQ